jgi:hypothetical protein
MPELSDGPNSFKDSETSFGGADAVNDTPDVPAHGTEPEERRTGTASGRVSPGGGLGGATLVLVIVMIIIVLVYLVGVFR